MYKLLKPAPVSISLTLSILNLPLSSSSTTSRELLSQFSTCSGWRWLEVGGKWENVSLLFDSSMKIVVLKTIGFKKIRLFFRDAKWCFDTSSGFKGLNGWRLVVFMVLYLWYCLIVTGSLDRILMPWWWNVMSLKLCSKVSTIYSYLIDSLNHEEHNFYIPWDDTALQTQGSKFKPWLSEAEHAISRSQYWIFTSERVRNILFLWNLKASVVFEPAIFPNWICGSR